MAVHPQKLGYNIVRGEMLNRMLSDEIRRVDDALLRSERLPGKNTIEHELQVSFGVLNIPDADIQRVIYSGVIESLVGRGFDVKIKLGQEMADGDMREKNVLFISWIAPMVLDDERTKMNDIIKAHRTA